MKRGREACKVQCGVWVCIYVCVYIHIYTAMKYYDGILCSLKKGNFVICDNIGEPGGHYTKYNKPDMERKILHSLIYL